MKNDLLKLLSLTILNSDSYNSKPGDKARIAIIVPWGIYLSIYLYHA